MRLAVVGAAALLSAATGLARAGDVGDGRPLDLVPGAMGTAITVLDGVERQEIPVRYLGTYRDFAGPGFDLHLIELDGPAAAEVGVAAGMSGSPVFFEGRLLGALSYRLGLLPKKPIAGVTPFENMLDSARAPGPAARAGADGLAPIATPVVAAGLAPSVRDWLAPQLEPYGLVLVSGGAAGAAPPAAASGLRPGSPVAVQLVRGDMRVAATGTVTWVDGDRVYAFGHPFLGSGRVELPMASAEVIHTLADMAGSIKLANIGEELGAIVEDRPSAIVGTLGRRAAMVPITLAVHGGDYRERTYRFEMANHATLAPLLGAMVVANSLRINPGYTQESTMVVRGALRLSELPEIPLEMAFAGQGASDPVLGIASEVFRTLGGLWSNPFGAPEVLGLELSVDVRPERVSYSLESVHYDRGTLRPGEPLELTCVLRRFRGEPVTRRLTVELPEDLDSHGPLLLAVGSPEAIDGAMGRPFAARLASAPDLDSLVRVLEDRRSAHRLTAVVFDGSGGLVSRGEAWTELPGTAERLLGTQAAPARRLPRVSVLGRDETELDGPVDGAARVRLRVERLPATGRAR